MDEQIRQLEVRVKVLEDRVINQKIGSELLKLPLDPTASGSMNQTFINTRFDKFSVVDLFVTKLHFQGGTAAAGFPVTISGGVIPMLATFMAVDTEAGAATDDLDTITATGVAPGTIVIISAANAARTVVAKDGTGNMSLVGDFTMDNSNDTLTLIMGLTLWRELARSDNAA